MKPNEIRNLDRDELFAAVEERRSKIQELRFSGVIGQTSNVREIRSKRREIARLLSIAREKERSA
jgi:ribosomal protein L29